MHKWKNHFLEAQTSKTGILTEKLGEGEGGRGKEEKEGWRGGREEMLGEKREGGGRVVIYYRLIKK